MRLATLILLISIIGVSYTAIAAQEGLRAGGGIHRWNYDGLNSFFVQLDLPSSMGSGGSSYLIPEIGYILPESRYMTKRDHYYFNLDYGYQFDQMLRFRIGTGVLVRRMVGEGGNAPVNTYGDTSGNFANPSQTRTGYALPINISIEGLTNAGFIKVTYQMLQALDAERRNTNLQFVFGLSL